jgi:hypothetical protein
LGEGVVVWEVRVSICQRKSHGANAEKRLKSGEIESDTWDRPTSHHRLKESQTPHTKIQRHYFNTIVPCQQCWALAVKAAVYCCDV